MINIYLSMYIVAPPMSLHINHNNKEEIIGDLMNLDIEITVDPLNKSIDTNSNG